MHWTLDEVARALGSTPPAGLDPVARVAGVSIDSRTLGAGELFFALRGPRHDGHSFVVAALAAGALAAVVARERLADFPEPVRSRLLGVDETLAALQQLARAVRRAWGGTVGRRMAAVTGSTGKTTTKEILAALLATRFRVLRSEGNLNNEYGLPLTLLRLEEQHQTAVTELGMSRRGELALLAKIAEPEIGIVTNVAPVHLEFFSSVDEIALAKRELIDGLAGAEPIAVLNADDSRVARFASGFRGRVLTFGFGAGAGFRAAEVESRGAEGMAFRFDGPGGKCRMELPLVGEHNLMNALAALAAASVWGIGKEEAAEVLRKLAPAPMRGEVLEFSAGFTVIDDCYNSNPLALEAMIGVLRASRPSGGGAVRRILVAGEMLELGVTSAELHRAAGRHALEAGVDCVFAVQGEARQIARAAEEGGYGTRARFFESSEEAAASLPSFVAPGDVILVKGSRGVHMERIVEALRAKHSLCAPRAAVGGKR